METIKTCPGCKQALEPNAVDGLCPKCLMQAALDTGVDVGPDTQAGGAHPAFVAPTPEELAPFFPQLEILELLGRGGMGAVYKARQKQLERFVAVKILPPGIGDDPAFAERFTREARALAKLNHPNIVTLYEFGQTDGLFYFIMEFVDGLNLRQLLEAGRIAPREALAIVPQICDALQYAHDAAIVHRDIKPENILLDRQGRVKVADFGLAKIVAAGCDRRTLSSSGNEPTPKPTAAELTEAGKIMGTPQYMAPEQTDHPSEVDHRADIYSLGVVFYQMLTGELPSGQAFAPPSTKVLIDVRLDDVVLRALEKKPERRYQQVSEVKTMVETIVGKPDVATSPTKQSLLWMFFGERPERRHLNWPFLLFYFSTLGLWLNGIFLAIELVPWLLNVGNTSVTPATVWGKLLWIAACVIGRQAAMVALNWDSKTVGWPAFAQRAKGITARMVILLLLIMTVTAVVASGLAILTTWMGARISAALAYSNSPTSLSRIAVWIAIAVAVGLFYIRRAWRSASEPQANPPASSTAQGLQTAEPSPDWTLWSPLQPPLEREVCVHMTETEKREATMRSVLDGLWKAGTFFGPFFCIQFGPSPLNWIYGSCILVVGLAFLPLWRKMGREFLCTTAWARQQGIQPDQLRSRNHTPVASEPNKAKPALGTSLPLFIELEGRRRLYWPGVLQFVGAVGLTVVPGVLLLAFVLWLLGARFGLAFTLEDFLMMIVWLALSAVMSVAGRKLGSADMARAAREASAGTKRKVVLFWVLAVLVALAVGFGLARGIGLFDHAWTRPREIEHVVVSKDQAIITGRPDAGMSYMIGGHTNNDVWVFPHNGSPFTITLETGWFDRRYHWVVKAAYRNVVQSLETENGPLAGPGKIVFRPGTPSPEADGSYVIGEFKSETGEALPIAVRLE